MKSRHFAPKLVRIFLVAPSGVSFGLILVLFCPAVRSKYYEKCGWSGESLVPSLFLTAFEALMISRWDSKIWCGYCSIKQQLIDVSRFLYYPVLSLRMRKHSLIMVKEVLHVMKSPQKVHFCTLDFWKLAAMQPPTKQTCTYICALCLYGKLGEKVHFCCSVNRQCPINSVNVWL